MRNDVCFVTASFIGIALAAADASGSSVEPLGTNFQITATASADAIGGKRAVAGDGTNFFVVWRDQRNQGTTLKDVFGARVGHDGTVLDPNGIPISTGLGDLQITAIPAVAFDGSGYLVVWVGTVPPANTTNEIYAARVGSNGVVSATDLQVTTGADPRPRPISISWNGSNFLLVWRTNSDLIKGLLVSPTGSAVGDAAGFTIGGGFYPDAAFDGTNHLVCWHNSGGDWPILAARIEPDGDVLDPGGFVVADPPMNQDHCSVASDGTDFLVTWHDWRPDGIELVSSAFAARVSGAGAVLDEEPIPLGTRVRGQTAVPVVFDGEQYFAAWMEENEPAKFRLTDLFGRRVSTDGAVLDAQSVPIASSYGHQFAPSLGYDNGDYLVAWNESVSQFGGGRCEIGCVWAQLLQKVAEPAPSGPGSPAAPTPDVNAALPVRGAAAWTPVSSGAGTDVRINRIGGSDSSHAYAATGVPSGSHNPLLRWNGSSWSIWASGPFLSRQFALQVDGPDDVWTAGWCWSRFHYDGVTLDAPGCYELGMGMGLWGDGTGSLLGVGVDGRSVLFDGNVWDNPSTGTNLNLWDVWGTALNDAVAVGEWGTAMTWDGGGWTVDPSVPTKRSLNAIWGSGDGELFAVGDSGEIVHFDGASWSEQTSGTTEHLFGVWGSGPNDVWAVGFGGTILHFDGVSWTPDESGTTEELLAIGGAGVNLWVAGTSGLILRRWVGLFSDGFEWDGLCPWSAIAGAPGCV